MNASITITGTLEEITAYLNRKCTCAEKVTVTETPTVETVETENSVSAVIESDMNLSETEKAKEDFLQDRTAIKKELDSMGVEYNNKCVTKTLAKLLEEEKAKITVTEVQTAHVEEKLKEAEVVYPKFEETVEALKKYAYANGTDKAKELLNGFGAEKISDLSDPQKLELIKKAEV